MKYIKKFEEDAYYTAMTSGRRNREQEAIEAEETEEMEEYNSDGVDLNIKFNDMSELKRAIEFFKNDSDYFPCDYNYEFNTLTFNCSDQDDADVTEKELDEELIKNDFSDYHFESE